MMELFCESWYDTHAVVPRCVIHGRSAPAVSSTVDVQPLGPVAVAGHRVTETPSLSCVPFAVKMMSRSLSRIVPALVTSMSASPSPTFTRPLPWIGKSVSIGPKKVGTEPKWPFHRLTANGSQPRPSTAITLFGPNVIAGSLSPLWFAGFDEKPGGSVNGARSTSFENAGTAAADPGN